MKFLVVLFAVNGREKEGGINIEDQDVREDKCLINSSYLKK